MIEFGDPRGWEGFWNKVQEMPSGCWEWTGRRTYDGYGQCKVRGFYRPHRYSYATFVGILLDHLEVDHVCRNRACVRPEHLEQVTRQENAARAAKAYRLSIMFPQGVPCR